MNQIEREIYVTQKRFDISIDVTDGSGLIPITLKVVDYVIPEGAIATAYSLGKENQLRKQLCVINENEITFAPKKGFFDEDVNVLQIRVTHNNEDLFSYKMTVRCHGNIADDDAQEVKSQPTLVARLLTEVGNLSKALSDEIEKRSHVGLIVQSTTLDTEEKVINLYGGTRWELIQGRFLLGKSNEYPINTTGGEEEHTLTEEEMPTHKHSGETSYAITDMMRVVSTAGSKTNSNHMTGYESSVYQDVNTAFPGQHHWHSFETNNVGNGSPHNNMPPYKTVYIWERVE